MLQALVVDDEQLTAELIGRFLEQTGKVKVEKILTNPFHVIEEVVRLKPDVVFLDIEMPEVTGLELAERIMPLADQPEIVFITAYDNYALEAFKVNALDYILKPLDPCELERVVTKISNRRPQAVKSSGLRINALGGFTVSPMKQQEPIKWKTSKCEELLAYLVFKKENHAISKWKLIDLLWPEKDESKSETNLRSTVYRTNKTLREYGIEGRIASINNGYRLEIENLSVDAFNLEKSILQWRCGESENLSTLQEFHRIYPGHLFEGLDYVWSEWLRTYYLRLFIDWGKDVIRMRLNNDADINTTYQMLDYIIKLDSFNEDLHHMAMEMLFIKEGAKAAIEQYQVFANDLMENIGVEPGEKIKDLYAKLLAN